MVHIPPLVTNPVHMHLEGVTPSSIVCVLQSHGASCGPMRPTCACVCACVEEVSVFQPRGISKQRTTKSAITGHDGTYRWRTTLWRYVSLAHNTLAVRTIGVQNSGGTYRWRTTLWRLCNAPWPRWCLRCPGGSTACTPSPQTSGRRCNWPLFRRAGLPIISSSSRSRE